MKSPWPTKKLGEICEENIKSPFKVENATNSGEYPFFTSGDNIFTHDEYLVDGENIFLATGGYANVKYYNGKTSYSADTWSLKVKNELTKFVFYQILARLKYIDEVLFRGSGLRHLQKKEFLNLEIHIPPLSIQQKIVKILDMIQEAVEIQEKIIEKTEELKKSLMAELFKYGSPSFRKGRKLKKTEVGEIPEDWEVVRLGEVVNTKDGIKRGPWGGSIKKEIFVSSGYKVYEQGNVLNNDFERGEYFISETKFLELKSFEVRSGDILVTAAGSLGTIAIVPENIKPGIINQALIRIRLDETKMTKKFFKYLFDKIIVTGMIEKYSHGATLKNFASVSILKNLKIPLPPLPEQQEIAEILQTIDQKIEIEKKKKELYEELFKTMLNKIMNQEIDVEKIEV